MYNQQQTKCEEKVEEKEKKIVTTQYLKHMKIEKTLHMLEILSKTSKTVENNPL